MLHTILIVLAFYALCWCYARLQVRSWYGAKASAYSRPSASPFAVNAVPECVSQDADVEAQSVLSLSRCA